MIARIPASVEFTDSLEKINEDDKWHIIFFARTAYYRRYLVGADVITRWCGISESWIRKYVAIQQWFRERLPFYSASLILR